MKFNPSRTIAAILALWALAGCNKAEPEHPPAAPARRAESPARSPAPPPDAAAAEAYVPPWARAEKVPPPASPKGVPASPAAPFGLLGDNPGVASALASLQALQAEKDPSPRQVASALERLERASGSSEFHGVRLDVLRRNLQVAEELQQLSSQLADIQKSERPPPDKEKLTGELLDRMRTLSQQINTSVMVESARSPS